jgi:LuxR family transcriptional regulator, maltose regulon positive regulatory protein
VPGEPHARQDRRPERALRAVADQALPGPGFDVPIETKLHAPSARSEWVPRAALVQRLAAVGDAKLVLVDAPAGFGKTTLVAQWRASPVEHRPFAWLSLDPGDDDPGRLCWQVVSALHRACPGLGGEDILRALCAPGPDLPGTVLPMLINALAALPGQVVLVLDGFDLIHTPACHEQIAALLAHLPPSLLLVVTTRADPPLPLARLRAAGELVEIRMRELRFTAPDAAAFIQAVSGIELSGPDLAELVDRTEGWPAAIYLAALSLRGHPSPVEFVRDFTGDNRFIVDFLAEEVLSRQPAEIRQFLTRTALLDRFSAPLCNAVTGRGNAAQIIDVLERENLFVVPLDEVRQWFRYHHLFGQVLRTELVTAEPALVPALHKRAAAWHRVSGSVGEAVQHSRAAGDTAGAVALIARHWYAHLNDGECAEVRGWLDSLTDRQIAASPVAAHCAAWVAALSGEPEPVRRWLPVIEAGHHAGALPDGIGSLRASAALLRAVYGFEGLQVMGASAGTAAGLENRPGTSWYALARATHGFSRYLAGDIEAAVGPLEEAVASEASSTLVGVLACATLALANVELGQQVRARDLAAVARRGAVRADLSEAPHSALAYIASGAVYAAEGRLKEARSELRHAVRFRRTVPGINPWVTLEAMLRLAQVLLDLGDAAGAREITGEAAALLDMFPDGAEFLQGRLARLKRQLAPARRPGAAEPLTEREMAVLRLLRGTLSLREISQELFVSPNTVKTHAQAVYRKLGVSTRHDAIRRGRELGIF